ncbi:MAG: hypothetical protein VKJ24_03940 [Synechococcales bacterium]|nr:hypothetical protein [Synechococcales bacterium]
MVALFVKFALVFDRILRGAIVFYGREDGKTVGKDGWIAESLGLLRSDRGTSPRTPAFWGPNSPKPPEWSGSFSDSIFLITVFFDDLMSGLPD